jgi:hypothetical protein
MFFVVIETKEHEFHGQLFAALYILLLHYQKLYALDEQ